MLVAGAGRPLLLLRPWEQPLALWASPAQPVVLLVISVAALLAVGATRRLTAMLLVGVTGYGTAMLFVLYGAPDLALTQFLVETMTIAIFVLVLRRLPERFSVRPLRRSPLGAAGDRRRRWARRSPGSRWPPPAARRGAAISERLSPTWPSTQGYGRNVVNVTLVDIRAWDTHGGVCGAGGGRHRGGQPDLRAVPHRAAPPPARRRPAGDRRRPAGLAAWRHHPAASGSARSCSRWSPG